MTLDEANDVIYKKVNTENNAIFKTVKKIEGRATYYKNLHKFPFKIRYKSPYLKRGVYFSPTVYIWRIDRTRAEKSTKTVRKFSFVFICEATEVLV